MQIKYFDGFPNFGDKLNLTIPELMGFDDIHPFTGGPHAMLIGSFLERSGKDSIVAGNGFISDRVPAGWARPDRIYAVRGRLTAHMLGITNIVLGDPALLLPSMYTPPSIGGGGTGFVPHYYDLTRHMGSWEGAAAEGGWRIIDVRGEPLDVVNQIAACDRILSSSLHGLIVADAYGIPNCLGRFRHVDGFGFKFADYYSMTDTPGKFMNHYRPGMRLDDHMFTVSKYVGDIGELRGAVCMALEDADFY